MWEFPHVVNLTNADPTANLQALKEKLLNYVQYGTPQAQHVPALGEISMGIQPLFIKHQMYT